MGRAYRRCKVPLVSAPLDLAGDVVDLLRALIDIESVSGNEAEIADRVEEALRAARPPDGDARRQCGPRSHRTRPVRARGDRRPSRHGALAGNLPSWTTQDGNGREIVWGRGACDMKAGVAVQLSVAAALAQPQRDITWVFYDNEEVEADRNGLGRIAGEHPELSARQLRGAVRADQRPDRGRLPGHHAAEVELTGVAAHSARAWMGHNAIHDAGGVLQRLAAYQPQQIEVDGLTYREGLNAVGITGGIAGNVIPDRCVIEVNYRFAPDKSAAQAEAYVREVLDGYSVQVIDVAAGARPGLDQPAAAEFLARGRRSRECEVRLDRCRPLQLDGHPGSQLRPGRSQQGPRRRRVLPS